MQNGAMIDMRDAHVRHFLALGREAQAAAVRRLAAFGHSVATIASATGLAPEAIRRILEGGHEF
ncbi:MAG: hypothetical protein ACREUG_01185 [Steroidobacteraceae bacterium]